MGRKAKRYPTTLIRARIRETYAEATRQVLCRVNFFDPSKPAHGDFSALIEGLLEDWLKKRMKPNAFNTLQLYKKAAQAKDIDYEPPQHS